MKKKFFILAAIFILISLPLFKKLSGVFFFEGIDQEVLDYIDGPVPQKILAYKAQNNRLPDSLSEIGLSDKFCTGLLCYPVKYSISSDRSNFYIAANANYPFVTYFYSDWSNLVDGRLECCFGYAYAEGSGGGPGLPIYREDSEVFATPSAWPKLENNSIKWFKYVPPFE